MRVREVVLRVVVDAADDVLLERDVLNMADGIVSVRILSDHPREATADEEQILEAHFLDPDDEDDLDEWIDEDEEFDDEYDDSWLDVDEDEDDEELY